MAVRKFTNIFVLLLILMVGSLSIHYSSFASHKKKATDRPTVCVCVCVFFPFILGMKFVDSGCFQMSTFRR